MMEELIDCPHIDIKFKPESLQCEFQKVLYKIRPTWNGKHVTYQQSEKDYNKGIINDMIKCSNPEDPNSSVMIRILNEHVNFINDREMEVAAVKEFIHSGCSPKLLATFNNGYCYDYIEGEVLTSDRLGEDPIWQHVAEGLAKFHAHRLKKIERGNSLTQIDHFVEACWDKYPDRYEDPDKQKRFKEEIPSRAILEAELNWIRHHCEELKSPLVFCHNDTRAENLIWNKEKDILTFVDFESAGFNYQAMEIAAQFSRFCGFYPPDPTLYPKEDFQLKWLSCYLKKYNKLKGFGHPNDIDIQKLYVQVSKCYLYYLLSLCIVFIALDNIEFMDNNVFSFFNYASWGFKEYFKEKEWIAEMKLPS